MKSGWVATLTDSLANISFIRHFQAEFMLKTHFLPCDASMLAWSWEP